jgi:chromosome segregation ATPase
MAKVNFEAVATAAEELRGAGQRISVRTVTKQLGGGSPNDVLKHIREWKAGRPLVRIAETDLDSRITTAIAEQMQRVAVAAAAIAEERAADVEDDLSVLVEAQQAAEQQIETLTVERDIARQRAEELASQLADVQATAERSAQAMSEQIVALRTELAGERSHQEKTASALARAEVRLESMPALQNEIERLRTILDASQQARQQAEQQAAVLAAKLDDSERHAGEIEIRASKAEQQAQKIITEAHAVAMKVSESAAALAGKLEDSERRSAEVEVRATKAEQQFIAITRELATANVAVQAGQARLESAARELDDAKKAATEARTAAKKSGEEAAELRGKYTASSAESPPGKAP